jgi:hypothetical protein
VFSVVSNALFGIKYNGNLLCRKWFPKKYFSLKELEDIKKNYAPLN